MRLTAKDALERTENYETRAISPIRDVVNDIIIKAANEGTRCVNYSVADLGASMQKVLFRSLSFDGFRVQLNSDRQSITISWDSST